MYAPVNYIEDMVGVDEIGNTWHLIWLLLYSSLSPSHHYLYVKFTSWKWENEYIYIYFATIPKSMEMVVAKLNITERYNDAITWKPFQHPCPFFRETTGHKGPVMWNVGVSYVFGLIKLFNNQMS